MNDTPDDIARKMLRAARRDRYTARYWAGWRLELTYGPYELAFDPARARMAQATAAELYRQLHGEPAPSGPEAEAAALAAQEGLWHLSVSWRGGHPAEAGRLLLVDLVIALGVPADSRDGRQIARMYDPTGRPSAQVTHWTWRDPQAPAPAVRTTGEANR